MPDDDRSHDRSELRRRLLLRWEDEGGAVAALPDRPDAEIPALTNTELVQLRVRVIALENLMMAVLAEGSDQQFQAARDMADYISPRPGSTLHPLTVQAAGHIADLVNRAVHLRNMQAPPESSAK